MASARTKQTPKKSARPRRPERKALTLGKVLADPIVWARLAFALKALHESGRLAGARTKRLSARVDPGLVKAARAKTGLENDSDLINAALAVIAAPDDFGPWFAAQAGRLPKDFELEL
jgi:hypothetical protein